jgi:hypothetical protein
MTGFPRFLRVAKRGVGVEPKMQKALEKRSLLWFLTPEMTRFFAETI